MIDKINLKPIAVIYNKDTLNDINNRIITNLKFGDDLIIGNPTDIVEGKITINGNYNVECENTVCITYECIDNRNEDNKSAIQGVYYFPESMIGSYFITYDVLSVNGMYNILSKESMIYVHNDIYEKLVKIWNRINRLIISEENNEYKKV